MKLRPIYSALLMATLLFGGGYVYYSALAVCNVPISYRIGNIDPRFKVSEDEVRNAISTAESLWEDGTDRNLFSYHQGGRLTINLVYDERQERAEAEEAFREILEKKEGVSDTVKSEYERLVAKYDALKTSYEAEANAYEEKLRVYNDEVADWNERGGAPKDVFERLESTKETLSREETRLNSLSTQLNTLVRRINALGSQGNSLITDYNSLVSEYNDRFSEGEEFTQGDYENNVINIYEFGSPEELEVVLAHELGHALGIDHVSEPTAIMYHHMEEQEIASGLTAPDQAAFLAICGSTSSMGETLKLIEDALRALLARF